ncbi:DNA repair protein RecO [Psychrobacter arenosus]|uniref:DNA repair protein RecO n=1 Tax=Psychrobacter arenosus TaxID=256326 RepID=UPI00191AF6F9|nr:DNA repair protein RecO C-terminal domain-containing protein [Psychrobacter arenosus]
MRNEALSGYVLHYRAYQEKRALYYLFTEQHGVVHGIGKRGLPLFEPLQMFATGKRELKTLTQVQITAVNAPIRGSQQYTGLYLNEILYRLLPVEDPLPMLWAHYEASLNLLRQPLSDEALKLCLREFESSLFNALGYEILLSHDSEAQPIDTAKRYSYRPDLGFVPIIGADTKATNDFSQTSIFSGVDLLRMQEQGVGLETLSLWSQLNRELIAHLLDYQPLQSRLLWQQQQRYQ